MGRNVLYITDKKASGIALFYELDDWGGGVRVPARAENFSLYHRVQNGSGAHWASYPMGTTGSFPGGKAAVCVKLTTHFHIVPRSIMRGAIPLLPQYYFVAWCSVKIKYRGNFNFKKVSGIC
jgi:hypothetical protein